MKSEDKKLLLVLSIFIVGISIFLIINTLNNNRTNSTLFVTKETSTIINQSENISNFPKNINLITKDELMQIDGIGEKTATKILDYRLQNKGFKNINELLNIDGIGEKTLLKLKNYLYVNNPEYDTENTVILNSATVSKSETTIIPKTNNSQTSIKYPIDINFATYDELITLDGIGDIKAEAIIDYRNSIGYFYSIQDIMFVSGIGEATFKNIKDFIKIDVSRIPPKPNITTKPTTTSANNSITSTSTTTITTTQETTFPLNSVNVNTANYEELMIIPGITEESIDAILGFRSHLDCKFSNLREVEIVIGTSQYFKIKEYITI